MDGSAPAPPAHVHLVTRGYSGVTPRNETRLPAPTTATARSSTLLIVANDALGRDPGNQQLISYYQGRLLESFAALEGKCQAAEPRSPECRDAVGALQTLAVNLLKAGSSGDGHDKMEQLFTARLTAAPPT